MHIVFRDRFYKDIKKLDSTIKKKLLSTIENVESSTDISQIKNVKKLKGHQYAYRIRIGDYRLGLFIDGKEATFARFLHRKDTYKYFP